MEIYYCLLLGLGVGLISSFLGIGGGILIVPLIPGIAGLGPKEAVATSLFTVFLVSSKNVISFARKKRVPFKPALSLGIGASVATFTVSQFLNKVDERLLVWILAAVIFMVSCRMLFWKSSKSEITKSSTDWSFKAAIIGIGIGSLVGFTGVGGGILFGPFLVGLRLVSDEEMSPGSNLAMALSSLVASIGFCYSAEEITAWKWGLIHADLAFIIFLGAFVSSQLGLHFQHKLPASWRRSILGVVLLFVFAKTIFRVI